jgi:hypothetical protein
MRRWTKLAVGAAAGVLPLLVGHAPATAATRDDSDAKAATFTSTSGATVDCGLTAAHSVNSDSGVLNVELITATSDDDPCRGGLVFSAQYVNRAGETARSNGLAEGAHRLLVTEFDAGSTAVTVDYGVTFANCTANCSHTLQTRTKVGARAGSRSALGRRPALRRRGGRARAATGYVAGRSS